MKQFLLALLALAGLMLSQPGLSQTPSILVFSKTEGFRHASIGAGVAAIEQLGSQAGFDVVATESADVFSDAGLASYSAVVFLSTTGNVLNASQQAAFERYIQGGGGYVGVHSASDTEYSWPWYGGLVGAYFQRHPAQQQATLLIENQSHPSTETLPAQWQRFDEWYDFQSNPRGQVNVLMTIDESTYSGGGMGADHPMAWYHEYDGGRAWYTALGHTSASYSEAEFLDHLLGGIQYAAGLLDNGPLTVSADGQWFAYRDSGEPFFMAGVGGPEGFLYETDARKQAIVDQLIDSGANALYMHTIRSFAGDGYDFEDPFNTNEDINSGVDATVLDNWRGFLDQLDANRIVSWIHIIDDTARPWGCDVPLPQTAKDYIETIVTRFRDLDHLVWLSGEEFRMGVCSNAEDEALMRAIAAEIRQHDPVHPIGVHHNNGQSMAFGGDPNINVFAQQICGNAAVRNPQGIHAAAERGDWVYVMAECHPWHLNLLHDNDRTAIRESNWATAMAGGYVLLYNAYECAHAGRLCSRNASGDPAQANDPHDPSAAILADLKRIQDFMLLADFSQLLPNDGLASADSDWVLANPAAGRYAAYSRQNPTALSVAGLDDGLTYALTWFDPITGLQISETKMGAERPFDVPPSLGDEVALSIAQQSGDPPGNQAPTARDDAYQAEPDTLLSIDSVDGLLANDSDPDGDDLSANLDTNPASGTLQLNDDGSFDYQPNTGFIGQDGFSYQANDGELDSAIAQVTITVSEPGMIDLWLIDAATDQRLRPLLDGDRIASSELSASGLFSVEAVFDDAQSIVFAWSGIVSGNRTESVAPFALFGDDQGDFAGESAVVGELTIAAEAFDQTGGAGSSLAATTVRILFEEPATMDQIFANSFESP